MLLRTTALLAAAFFAASASAAPLAVTGAATASALGAAPLSLRRDVQNLDVAGGIICCRLPDNRRAFTTRRLCRANDGRVARNRNRCRGAAYVCCRYRSVENGVRYRGQRVVSLNECRRLAASPDFTIRVVDRECPYERVALGPVTGGAKRGGGASKGGADADAGPKPKAGAGPKPGAGACIRRARASGLDGPTARGLCASATNPSIEPVLCYSAVGALRRGVDGGSWTVADRVALCRASPNHSRTMNCFDAQIRRDKNVREAIAFCGR